MYPMKKNKYHIIVVDTKTKEQKMFVCEAYVFSEVASKAYLESRKLWEITSNVWEIASIYNVEYDFDTKVNLT